MMQDLPQRVLDYLEAQKTVTVATASGDGTPHASTFMYVNDGPTLYFWARPTSTTADHLEGRAAISFAIDEYVEDWNKAKGIQGMGLSEVVSSGDEVARVVGLFADKFPAPSAGASTTSIMFFRIVPSALQFIDGSGEESGSKDEFGPDFHREDVLSAKD